MSSSVFPGCVHGRDGEGACVSSACCTRVCARTGDAYPIGHTKQTN